MKMIGKVNKEILEHLKDPKNKYKVLKLIIKHQYHHLSHQKNCKIMLKIMIKIYSLHEQKKIINSFLYLSLFIVYLFIYVY